jgi:lipopolysaccharide/colanic/teichoic acid biosynthesis glycosyltransferase
MKIKRVLLLIFDILIITLAFLICIWYKPATKKVILPGYIYPFLVYAGIWLIISAFSGKYQSLSGISIKTLNKNIIMANFIVMGTITLIMYLFRFYSFSRLIVLGTVILSTVFEIIAYNLMFYLVNSQTSKELEAKVLDKQQLKLDFEAPPFLKKTAEVEINIPKRIKDFIIKECNESTFRFLLEYIDIADPKNLLISTTTRFNIEKQPENYFQSLVNLKRINDIRYLNKFFETVNAKLPKGALFIGCVETKNQRKRRILKKYPPFFNILFYSFDYIFKRVFPKFSLTKRIYFLLTRGNNRVLTRAETLGRLYSCGFEIIDERYIAQLFFFVVRKIKDPVFDPNPTYGPFIRLKRVGKNGKEIKAYKFRTMHPYAEYLQEYVYQKHQLQEGGKFNNDFRVTTLGKFMRKLWIDELPMIFNILKRDLKIVGVRPISKQYFDLYPNELKEKRTKTRPGLIPPFYADMPKTLDDIVASELKYLDLHTKHPLRTDIKYFFKAFKNIIFKRARSN